MLDRFIKFLGGFFCMVSIIGAGPVGNYLAGLLAEKGICVDVYEEHKKIGKPIACTGILTSYLNDLIKVDKSYVVNTVNQTNVYAPNGKFVNVKLKKNYVVDRALFDSYFGEIARSEGAKYHLEHGLEKLKRKNENYILKFRNGKNVKDEKVVGADGPNSVVGRSIGLLDGREFVVGHQARVRVDEKVESKVVDFFLGVGFIGWSVPESESVVRLGVASRKNAKMHFDWMMKKRNGKILEWQSGVIPVYNSKLKTEKDNVYLVGDAAGQVKATTHGGIIPGMCASEILCDVLVDDLRKGSYEKGWRKKIGKDLKIHLLIRKIMNKFDEKDYDELVELTGQDKITKLIGKYDREYPSKLLISMVFKEPRFLKYAKFLLRS